MRQLTLFISFLLTQFYVFTQDMSGIVNSYARVTTIGSCALQVDTATDFQKGDIVMLVQMKGGTIDQTNTANFGDILTFEQVGQFEVNEIAAISGNTLYLRNELAHNYIVDDILQIVGIQPVDKINTVGTITAKPWNGNTGGIIFLNATDSIVVSDSIKADGLGYRGGDTSRTRVSCGVSDYFVDYQTGLAGAKGESIITLPQTMAAGKGPLATGGGGGSNNNTGGGGGSNGGSGGVGGYEYSGASGTCPGTLRLGGLPGNVIDFNTNQLLLMGAGGGGGQQNNYFDGVSLPQAPYYGQGGTKGGNGGGIIFLKTNTIVVNANARISSDGLQTDRNAGRDGAGGGGAGGTVFLEATTITSTLEISAIGGAGGDVDNNNITNACHGTGGGGGGGVVFTSQDFGVLISSDLSGGRAGLILNTNTSCYNTTYGAVDGNSGATYIGLSSISGGVPASCPYDVISTLNDTKSVIRGESLSIGDFIDNDSYTGGITITNLTTSSEGQVTYNSGVFDYISSSTYLGNDTLFYQICQNAVPFDCAEGMIIINVIEGNRAPTAADDNVSYNINQSYTFDPRGNDSDPEGDPLTVWLAPHSFGLGTVNVVNNTITFDINSNTGTEVLKYYACDPENRCDSANITVTVTDPNNTPVAADDEITINIGQQYIFDPRVNDNDLDGDQLTVTLLSNFFNLGTAQVNNNSVDFQINSITGIQSLDYQICDQNGKCDTATITVNVVDPNDGPVAVDDTYDVYTDNEYTFDVVSNDTDPNGDDLTIFILTPLTLGKAEVINNQIQVNVYDEGGQDQFTYMVCDPSNICDTAVVTLNITELNDLVIPEGFSPNGDGINDYFEIVNLDDYEWVSLKIYNRWGQVIYENEAYLNDWSGDSKHSGTLPDGTYYYDVEVSTGQEFRGYVIIKR